MRSVTTSPRCVRQSTRAEQERGTRAPLRSPRSRDRSSWSVLSPPHTPIDSGSVGRRAIGRRHPPHDWSCSPRSRWLSGPREWRASARGVLGGPKHGGATHVTLVPNVDCVRSARADVVHGCLLPTWDKRSVRRLTLSVTNLQGNRRTLENNGVTCTDAAQSVVVLPPARSVVAASAVDRLQSVTCNQKISCRIDRRSCSWTRSLTSNRACRRERAGA